MAERASDQLLTEKEVASLLSCSTRYVRKLAAEGKLRKLKDGARFTRYRLSDVRKYQRSLE